MEELVCSACGKRLGLGELAWRCECGGVLDLAFTGRLDAASLAGRAGSLWRYREALPVRRGDYIVTLGEGMTPLIQIAWDGARPLLKLEHQNPTGSFKDRGAAVLITVAKGLGVRAVVEDSSGNAGSAIAAYAAAAGMTCRILVPAYASEVKLIQVRAYGAAVQRIEGSREEVAAAAQAACAAAGAAYYASHYWNPLFFEGTKTFAFEVWEQLGRRVPEAVVVPTGHGTLLLGAHKGFGELRAQGLVNRLPRLIAVQSAACAPLYEVVQRGLPELPPLPPPDTFAEGIAIRTPIRWRQMVRAIAESGGEVARVPDAAVQAALLKAARLGILMEPTAATALAGYSQLLETGRLARDTEVVIPITGSGLKAPDKIASLLSSRPANIPR